MKKLLFFVALCAYGQPVVEPNTGLFLALPNRSSQLTFSGTCASFPSGATGICMQEGAAPTGIADTALLYPATDAATLKAKLNNGSEVTVCTTAGESGCGGTVPSYSTAGRGVYCLLDQCSNDGSSWSSATANRHYLFQITPKPWTRTLRKAGTLSFGIPASTNIAVCIYSIDGATKITNSDAVRSGSISSGSQFAWTFAGDVTLAADTAYLFAIVSDNGGGAALLPRTSAYGGQIMTDGTNQASYAGYSATAPTGSGASLACASSVSSITWAGDTLPLVVVRP